MDPPTVSIARTDTSKLCGPRGALASLVGASSSTTCEWVWVWLWYGYGMVWYGYDMNMSLVGASSSTTCEWVHVWLWYGHAMVWGGILGGTRSGHSRDGRSVGDLGSAEMGDMWEICALWEPLRLFKLHSRSGGACESCQWPWRVGAHGAAAGLVDKGLSHEVSLWVRVRDLGLGLGLGLGSGLGVKGLAMR